MFRPPPKRNTFSVFAVSLWNIVSLKAQIDSGILSKEHFVVFKLLIHLTLLWKTYGNVPSGEVVLPANTSNYVANMIADR